MLVYNILYIGFIFATLTFLIFKKHDEVDHPGHVILIIIVSVIWPVLLLLFLIVNYINIIIKLSKYYKKEGKKKLKDFINSKINNYKLRYLIYITKNKSKKEVYNLNLPKWF